MFKEERTESKFEWTMLGNVSEGRPNLGENVPVDVYRLMQFTLRDAMIQAVGVEATDAVFYDAGKKAGLEFLKNMIGKADTFSEFVERTQEKLKDLGIGILRVENADLYNNLFTLTVSEDLDCSGLPITDEEICVYDEGFIAGLLLGQTNMKFDVKEIDCWCSGDRVCRFDIRPSEAV
ncbi:MULTISPECIES: V4R domain-containing protein [unclassified Fusibacter]|uniref:V4R domain-containing protein n=1 Tax=unclassified Fusibacter TaxID=2624464 RepID=UPI00101302C3|nr:MULTISPECIES: V4R domain-containing protein [unclassified Fusibacter]MCK8060307.1 4-vinyl reductase [Fusibacter sp. A2]NPE20404.1 4-vinyl reductase [Fusibacter sp. A1]RXV63609.1 4-vinyl reductase [Fusibacter sp. A1]